MKRKLEVSELIFKASYQNCKIVQKDDGASRVHKELCPVIAPL